jgi:hypothetical protein
MPPVKAAVIAPSSSSALHGPLSSSPNRLSTTKPMNRLKAIT